jgi:hypothetical protein
MRSAERIPTMTDRREGIEPFIELDEGDALFQARAIWQAGREIDIPPDRKIWKGAKKNCRALGAWLSKVGIPGLKEVLRRSGLTGRDRDEVKFADMEFVVAASPRASYGYLYLVAHKVETT